MRSRLASIFLTALLAGCALPPPYSPPSRPAPAPAPPGTTSPQRPSAPPLIIEDQSRPPAAGTTGTEPAPAPAPEYRLGPATQALVAQARTQAAAGDYPVAAGTIERALRIEPDNPLLWIELGRIRLTEGNAVQAESLGRKAVSLASGDARAESTAWQLVAEALQQRGRTAEAIEAEARARSLRTR